MLKLLCTAHCILPSPLPQVRNRMCARCAAKASAKAPTSSPTAGSTAVTGRSAAPAVSTASSAGLTYSATKRHSAAMTFTLKTESHEMMATQFSIICNMQEEMDGRLIVKRSFYPLVFELKKLKVYVVDMCVRQKL